MTDRHPASVPFGRKPPWLKVRAPGGEVYRRVSQTLSRLKLHTVCQSARCPNVAECWGRGTATVLLLGPTCTRGCRFCAVPAGHPSGVVEAKEPGQVAEAVAQLGLRYVVLTMVTRDDLPDGGAAHVAATVRQLRRRRPEVLVETLVSDFGGSRDALDQVLDTEPAVLAHNVEVVPRLTGRVRDQRCSYELSLQLLRQASTRGRACYVKSSVMVGVGETDAEVLEALGDLRAAGVQIVTLGQYLRPSPRSVPVARYVEPERFADYASVAQKLGFACVASGPLVRSSYRAAENFVQAQMSPSARPAERGAPHSVIALGRGPRNLALDVETADSTRQAGGATVELTAVARGDGDRIDAAPFAAAPADSAPAGSIPTEPRR